MNKKPRIPGMYIIDNGGKQLVHIIKDSISRIMYWRFMGECDLRSMDRFNFDWVKLSKKDVGLD